MTKGFFLLCAVAALPQASASLAAPDASATATPAPAPAAEPRICRSEGVVGSRLGRARACHTAAEWAELHRQARANVEHIQTNRPWNVCPSNSPANC